MGRKKPLGALLGPDKNRPVVFDRAGPCLSPQRSPAPGRPSNSDIKSFIVTRWGTGLAGNKGLPVANAPRDVIETAPAPVGPFLSWSNALDPLRVFWRRYGSEPDALRLPADTDHGFPDFSGLSGGSRSPLAWPTASRTRGACLLPTPSWVWPQPLLWSYGGHVAKPGGLAVAGGHSAHLCRQPLASGSCACPKV